jgi:hypothetical protein
VAYAPGAHVLAESQSGLDVGNQGGAGKVGALGSIGVAHPNTEIGQREIALSQFELWPGAGGFADKDGGGAVVQHGDSICTPGKWAVRSGDSIFTPGSRLSNSGTRFALPESGLCNPGTRFSLPGNGCTTWILDLHFRGMGVQPGSSICTSGEWAYN